MYIYRIYVCASLGLVKHFPPYILDSLCQANLKWFHSRVDYFHINCVTKKWVNEGMYEYEHDLRCLSGTYVR